MSIILSQILIYIYIEREREIAHRIFTRLGSQNTLNKNVTQMKRALNSVTDLISFSEQQYTTVNTISFVGRISGGPHVGNVQSVSQYVLWLFVSSIAPIPSGKSHSSAALALSGPLTSLVPLIALRTPHKSFGEKAQPLRSNPAGYMDVCLFWMCVISEVSPSGWSLVQSCPAERDVSECDREASINRRPWPTRGCCAMERKGNR